MKKIIILMLALIAQACSTFPAAVLPEVTQSNPVNTSIEQTKKIYVSGIKSVLSEKSIGQMRVGTACMNELELTWANNPNVNEVFRAAVIQEIANFKFNIATDAFDLKNQEEAKVLLAGRVVDVKANICNSIKGVKGDAVVTVDWDIYEKKSQSIKTIRQLGFATIPEFSLSGDPDLYRDAVQSSVKNLLGSDEFYKIVKK